MANHFSDAQGRSNHRGYLSGNVREKLAAAERAGPGYSGNAEALRVVQPEDVLPGDIDANLGAPWIPASDIQAFAAELFHVKPSSVPVAHLQKDAVWGLEADYAARQSVAATSEFGTARANGAWLLELALNMKSPTIHDTIESGGREEKVVNQEATMAAREKQKLIKERFRAWVFTDPQRTERLVRLYNDTYNNLRPRLFDGSHLDFPSMNQNITLRAHQNDAVWRGMSSGNTLLAHAVGAGKTFTMAATGMKMKQAGLIKKPMYVVPNHLLEQFSREFMQLYPNAKLLVAAKEDLGRDRRKQLTAKIASGEWRTASSSSSLPAQCPRSSTPSSKSWWNVTNGYGHRRLTHASIMRSTSPPMDASWPPTPGCSPPTRPTSRNRRSTGLSKTSPPFGSGPPRHAGRR